MDISCVIPTVRGDDHLARAVTSILAQTVDAEFEVIVVDDSGKPLSAAEWLQDPRVTVIKSNRVERCFARNAGASPASGEWLHFLDDDDYVLPGAYAALIERARATGAGWTYGAYNCVDDDGRLIEMISPTLEGDVFVHAVVGIAIPMGASLINRQVFLSVGGFDPDMIPGEDADLIQRISRSSHFAVCPEVIASFRVGTQGETTTAWSRSALTGRLRREKQFMDSHSLPRILEGLSKAKDGGVLRGRLARFYGASAIRHVRSSPLTALSRALVALRLAAIGVPNSRFIRGLRGGW